MHTKVYTEPSMRSKTASSANHSSRTKTSTVDSLSCTPDANLPTCLVEAVENAVAEAFAKTYTSDPLIPEEVAALRGPVDSVLRRHGLLIESALAVALDLSSTTEVMTQVAVPLSEAAIQLCLSNADDRTTGLTLPVTGAVAKTAMIDVVVYYPGSGRLVAVSVKRGGGPQGGVAARQAPIELRAAAMILRGMLMGRGRIVSTVEVVTVDYLGRSGIVAGTVITGDQLDTFFGVAVRATIDAMTAYMAAEVGRRIDEAVETLVRSRRPVEVAQFSSDIATDTAHSRSVSDGFVFDPVPPPPLTPRMPSETVPGLAECLSLPPRIKGRPSRLHA